MIKLVIKEIKLFYFWLIYPVFYNDNGDHLKIWFKKYVKVIGNE